MLAAAIYSFIVAFFVDGWSVHYFGRHGKLFSDTFEGPQKFHLNPTPRNGGLGIFLGFLVSATYLWIFQKNNFFILLLIASFPVFLAGLIEDLTKKVGVKARYLASILSAFLGIYFLDIILNRLDIPFIDNLFQYKIFAISFTVFAVAGVSNAINIIDGFNGLASMVSIIIFLGFGYVGYKIHDPLVVKISLIMIGGIAGFFIWNYPFGKIFLGDGGAYFIGFIIGELSVYLVKNYKAVSAWFPLLLVIYPVVEVLFSIYRKRLVRKHSPFIPDGLHFHMLVYKRIIPFVLNINGNDIIRNSATSPFLWLICSIGVIPAVVFWNNTLLLVISSFVFCLLYVYLYRAIVRFSLLKSLNRKKFERFRT